MNRIQYGFRIACLLGRTFHMVAVIWGSFILKWFMPLACAFVRRHPVASFAVFTAVSVFALSGAMIYVQIAYIATAAWLLHTGRKT